MTDLDMIMDSGYTSGSGDEVIICVSPPTEEKPIAKFRCQLCNIFLNSPLQAKQVSFSWDHSDFCVYLYRLILTSACLKHIASQRHRINLNVIGTFVPVDTNETSSVQNFTVVGRPSFRRRGVGSLRKVRNSVKPNSNPIIILTYIAASNEHHLMWNTAEQPHDIQHRQRPQDRWMPCSITINSATFISIYTPQPNSRHLQGRRWARQGQWESLIKMPSRRKNSWRTKEIRYNHRHRRSPLSSFRKQYTL